MHDWQPHIVAKSRAPDRCKVLRKLRACQQVDAIPSVDEGDPAHSILGDNMPVRDANEDGSKYKIKYSILGFLSSLSAVGFAHMSFDNTDWSS